MFERRTTTTGAGGEEGGGTKIRSSIHTCAVKSAHIRQHLQREDGDAAVVAGERSKPRWRQRGRASGEFEKRGALRYTQLTAHNFPEPSSDDVSFVEVRRWRIEAATLPRIDIDRRVGTKQQRVEVQRSIDQRTESLEHVGRCCGTRCAAPNRCNRQEKKKSDQRLDIRRQRSIGYTRNIMFPYPRSATRCSAGSRRIRAPSQARRSAHGSLS